jgi:mono/diheme cytochrome c family protein
VKRRIVIVTVTLLVVIGAVSIVWIQKMAGGFSAREQPSAMETLAARATRRMAIPAGAKAQKNPFTSTADILTDARHHFADHCALCHANNGSGTTEIGQNLYPKVPDMRLPTTQNLTDGEIYYVIHNGIRLTGMPAWGGPGQDDDSWKLVRFIQHLPQLTADEEREMESLNPKGPGEKQEELEEEQFLNESQPSNQKAKPPTHHHH